MLSKENFTLNAEPSSPTKPPTSSASEMLNSSEIQSLRRIGKEQSAFAREAFTRTK